MKLFSLAIVLVPAVLVGCYSPVETIQRSQTGRVGCIASEKMIITHEQAQGLDDASWVTVCPESLWLCGDIRSGLVGEPYITRLACTKMDSIPDFLKLEVDRRRGGGRVVIE